MKRYRINYTTVEHHQTDIDAENEEDAEYKLSFGYHEFGEVTSIDEISADLKDFTNKETK